MIRTVLFSLLIVLFAEASTDPTTLKKVRTLRDPFKKPDLAGRVEAQRVKSELEQFATGEFRMTGVITGPGETRAMLVAPNSKTYFVRLGDRIGIQEGVITDITPEKIFVKEKSLNLLGEEETILTEILLPSEFIAEGLQQ